MTEFLSVGFYKPKCSTCGSAELCEFCLRYKIDNRLSFSENAVWIPTKGFCVNGISVRELKDK